ncbi:MAG: hypothetical protein IH606_16575 [Burkholderiales bacterium]|nr:hypothetical protein [Burkholderiales bacterium]
MKNPNENCLEGMRCPQCKSFGPFLISADVLLSVSDDGAVLDDFANMEWEDSNDCRCPACDHEGVVSDFRESPS